MQANERHGRTQSGVVAALIVLGSVMPLAMYWTLLAGAATVTPWQAKQLLRQPKPIFVLVENWVCAAAAVLLLVIALVLAQFPGVPALHRAQVMFAAGVGPLGFGLLRVLMGGVYSYGKVWFGFWEEMTELLLLAGICFTLWTFRAQLLPAWQQLLSQDVKSE